LACLLLVAAAIVVYYPVHNYDFVYFDDITYVYENPYVKGGVTSEGLKWAFSLTNNSKVYWHPLTWMSHMLDCELFGLRPGLHHLTSLTIHILNTLLLFIIFKQMTGDWWQSLFVAALFGLHPINVDSVAWIAERKNVLSTFFWMLTMLAYVRYCKSPTVSAYMAILLAFSLGLLSKPMLVTLPCVFFLLDYWPLCRIKTSVSGFTHTGTVCTSLPNIRRVPVIWLLFEKIPLLALSLISIFLASQPLQNAARFISFDMVPLNLRVSNALIAYVLYAWKMVVPQNLAVFYPFPQTMPPMWQISGALLILLSVSVFCVLASKRMPHLITGWLWYLGTLVPVIGLVQGGLWPAMADRWAYIPLIGLFIMVVWSVPEIMDSVPGKKKWLATATTIVLSILLILTHKQVQHWKNSITLFTHTLEVTSNHSLPHNNLGFALAKKGQTDDAIEHFREALRINPDHEKAHYNLGDVLAKKGQADEAIKHYKEALRIKPDFEQAHSNLGHALAKKGHTDNAIEHYRVALRINPDSEKAHNNLALALAMQGQTDDAIEHFREALRIKPDNEKAHSNLGLALVDKGQTDDAIEHFREALRIKPDLAEAYNNLAVALCRKGDIVMAVEYFQRAIQINPNYLNAKNNLKNVLEFQSDSKRK